MNDLEDMIVEGFDTGTRVARHSQVCRALVAGLPVLDTREAELVQGWDRGLSVEERKANIDLFWARTKDQDNAASARAWLFYGLVQDEVMVDGTAAGLLIMWALQAGLRDEDVARAFGIIH